MSREAALLESPTLRRSLCDRVEALDHVKALVLLPDGLHITTRMVADYFEVGERAINTLVQRHRAELVENGLKVIHRVVHSPANPQVSPSFNLKPTSNGGWRTALYTRRSVLNIAMLLRRSDVARRVRSHLLDVEGAAAVAVDRDALLTAAEQWVLAGQVGDRLAACERMVLADRALVRAMSARLCEVAHDMRELREDVAELRRGLGRLGAVRPRRWSLGR
ncbi:hypothetical protein [Kitasatospora sp. DSM 101779]|uniref:hypothetical protein n=1 Tax=Kitasatospora sp. DSM 101779 TaxID=2853165 RepID=UPI0021D9417A|nr:hypothetical protein [Kitasatospora sp. DSM 101779]MCU7823655.1 hypothetical protein [Kitasatospora sp. DSM 101779]